MPARAPAAIRPSAFDAERYLADGYVFPVRALPAEAARRVADDILLIPQERLSALPHPWRQKANLLFPAIDRLTRTCALVDAATAVLGPDVAVISADLFIKGAEQTGYVSWHQDSHYWRFDRLDTLTAWVALTPATPENGAMRFLRGSHRLDRLPHAELRTADNMLSHGQEIVGIDTRRAIDVRLAPGEASFHHPLLAHASGPNRTGLPRVGVAIRYASPALRQLAGPPVTVMMVAGRDRWRRLAHDPRPRGMLTAAAIAAHTAALAPHAATRYATV